MRKLGLFVTFWTSLLFYPLSSFALGLGEIEVSSFLNQPLKAEIEVISPRPGEVDDLLVSLASRDAFEKAGLERPSDLSKLRFKVIKAEDGLSATIQISTKTPVKEPFLNFLVEADWAKGRLLREFTVLLDPPYFSQQAAPAITTEQPQPVAQPLQAEPAPITEQPQPVVEESMAQAETEPFEPESQPIALTEEPTSTEAEESIPYVEDNAFLAQDDASEIVVQKGDTLWGIASQFKDDDHSMAQVMMAMQSMNPDAFTNENINNLKVGAVLRVPDQISLDSFSRQEAYAQVLEQNGLWDDYVARKTGVVEAGSPVATDEQSTVEEGDSQLTLVTPDDGVSESASLQNDENSENAGQIRKQLALAEEELEASRIENDDLKSRIADLELQLNKFEELQKLVQIEDDSMAQLQDNVTAEDSTETSEVMSTDEVMPSEEMQEVIEEVAEEQPTEVMIEAADEMMSEQADAQIEESSTDQLTEEMSEDEMSEGEMSEEMTSETEEIASEGTEEAALPSAEEIVESGDQMETEEESALPAPVIVTEAPVTDMEGGVLDMVPSAGDLLKDPVLLGGIGAILALLLGFIFFKRRKTDDDSSGITLEEPTDLIDDDQTPIHVPTAEDAADAVEEKAEDILGDTGVMDTEQHMADKLTVDSEQEAAESPIPEEAEDEFGKTAVLSASEMPSADEQVAQEQDDVLNEVDVYLAYGLYDNAQDLLKESLQSSPERADYRAKLLDTYFATKNADGFVNEAQALKSLGAAADRFWDRVQIMGFELAPDNELFAGAKDSDISVADLEYAKPDAADFDIGADEDITDFSNTDFELGGDSENFTLESTQVVPPGDEVELGETDETLLREDESIEATDNIELPDEIGEFDLDLGDEVEDLADELDDIDDDALSFDLPEDLDLSSGEEPTSDSLIPLDPTVEAPKMDKVPPMASGEVEAVSDELDSLEELDSEPDQVKAEEVDLQMESEEAEEVDLQLGADESDLSDDDTDFGLQEIEEEDADTVVMPTSDDEEEVTSETVLIEPEEQVEEEGTRHIEAALDMDMSDLESADLNTGVFETQEDTNEASDGDITEFSPAEITGEFTAFDADAAIEEVDAEAGIDKTGTFAPGDFTDESSTAEASEEIEDLMLPDDVDEVATKLDLAKAFIDMGDAEGARGSLEEVMSEGTQEQRAEATGLLEKI